MKYRLNEKRRLLVDEPDDNEGEPRVTPAGSTVYIMALDFDTNQYIVACRETEGWWFYTEEEFEARTEAITEPMKLFKKIVVLWSDDEDALQTVSADAVQLARQFSVVAFGIEPVTTYNKMLNTKFRKDEHWDEICEALLEDA